MRSTGEYNQPDRLRAIANKYLKMAEKERQEGRLANEAYYEGYANALLLIFTGADTPEMIQHFPFMWLPDALHRSDESSFEPSTSISSNIPLAFARLNAAYSTYAVFLPATVIDPFVI